MKSYYYVHFLVFAVFLCILHAEASETPMPRFDPVRITGPLEFQIRYLHRYGQQERLHPLMSGSILRPGDSYGISFTPFQSCYVYIFEVTTKNQHKQLFPALSVDSLNPENSNPVKGKA